jgi:bifunctional UDP-N-acetylglucosamine pyrophosphorylase/glucosamine-1-phosphate N-acetyltransferase
LRGRTSIGKNCIIETGVVIVDSQVADGTHIKAGSAIEESQIGPNCIIGPMAHLRPGNVLTGNNKIGNFVEMKKSVFGEKSQASHLTYIGDSEVGRNVTSVVERSPVITMVSINIRQQSKTMSLSAAIVSLSLQ